MTRLVKTLIGEERTSGLACAVSWAHLAQILEQHHLAVRKDEHIVQFTACENGVTFILEKKHDGKD